MPSVVLIEDVYVRYLTSHSQGRLATVGPDGGPPSSSVLVRRGGAWRPARIRPCFRRPAPRDMSRFWFPEGPDGEEGGGDGYGR